MGEPVHSNDVELEILKQLYDSQTPTSPDNQIATDQIEQDNSCPETPTNSDLPYAMGEPVHSNDVELEILKQLYDSQTPSSPDNQVPTDQIEQDNSCPETSTHLDRTTDKRQIYESCPQACMVCRRSVKCEAGWTNIHPGDHIEAPMFKLGFKLPIKHHAIVEKMELLPKDKAKLTVIDVPQKKHGSSSNFKIECHKLKYKGNIELKRQTIKKVEYKCRGYSESQTVKRAQTSFNKQPDMGNYSLCLRNCEHFAVAMVCGTRDIVTNASKIKGFKNSLQPGDHIELSNQQHVIVQKIENISEDNKKAKLTTIGISKTGENKNDTTSETPVLRCIGEVHYKTITKINYKDPKNNHAKTLERAQGYVGKKWANRFCEEFAIEMVNERGKDFSGSYIINQGNGENDSVRYINNQGNGEDKSASCIIDQGNEEDSSLLCVNEAMCLQSVKGFWIVFHLVLSILQCAGFILNFYLYAVYAENNEKYNHVFGNTSTNSFRWCYTGCNIRGLTTICDWLFLGMMVLIYLFCYMILLRRQKKIIKNICLKCKVSARLIFLTKIGVFILMEIFNIFSELWIYKFVEWKDSNTYFTLFVLITFSLVELIFGFFIAPNFIVKRCLLRRFPKCKGCCPKRNKCCLFFCCCPWDFDKDSYKYFNLYG